MLWRTSSLGDFGLEATDGAIGAIRDCLFDDTDWKVRWLVVDTGTWLPGRRVLLAPAQLAVNGDGGQVLSVGITKQQVRDSPPFESDQPVSRQYEERLIAHYGWPEYWMDPSTPAMPVLPEPVEPPEPIGRADPHLRSTAEMSGYHIQAKDGTIGHIGDFLLDPDAWVVRYLVVDTRDWWPGKQVLVVPKALTAISWADRHVEVDLTREQIKNGPEFDPDTTVDRELEERYLGYYGYPVYW